MKKKEPEVELTVEEITDIVDEQMESWREYHDGAFAGYGTKSDIAEQTGLHSAYLGRLATGQQEPSLRTALLIAQATGKKLQNTL